MRSVVCFLYAPTPPSETYTAGLDLELLSTVTSLFPKMCLNKDQLLYMEIKPVSNSEFTCMLMLVCTHLSFHMTDVASVSADSEHVEDFLIKLHEKKKQIYLLNYTN